MTQKALSSAVFALALSLACGGDDGGGSPPNFPADPRPSKRSDVASIADPATGQLVIFGGDNGPIVNQSPMPSYIGETWLLDLQSGWTQITGTAPSARGRYAVALTPSGQMLLFGGRYRAGTSGDYELYADVWAFDYVSQAWSQLDDGTGGPSPRYFSTAAFDTAGDRLVIFGGGTNTAPIPLSTSNEVWTLDDGTWTQETTSGTPPSQRLFMAYTHDSSRNHLIVYGGQIGDFVSPSLGDLYSLDLATLEWSQLHDGNGTAPPGRFSGSMTYDAGSDRYILFGGHADPGVVNDVWGFDPNSKTWALASAGDSFTGAALGCLDNPREIPTDYISEDLSSPERRSGAAVAMIGEELIVFGGESDCSDHLDDVWTFGGSGWSELLEARTGESCARKGDDCTCLCL